MQLTLTIDPWVAAAVLAYLLAGALGVLIYQSNCYAQERLGFGLCLFWVICWLPAGAVALLVMFVAAA